MQGLVYRYVTLFAIPIFWACSGSDSELQGRIAAAVQQGDGTVIRIAALTDFEWERFHVFGPYTSAEEIEQELGSSWWRASWIEPPEHLSLLVFTSKGAVVRYVEQPRNRGDFAALNNPLGWSPAEAVFIVRIEEIYGPPPWLVLKPLPLR